VSSDIGTVLDGLNKVVRWINTDHASDRARLAEAHNKVAVACSSLDGRLNVQQRESTQLFEQIVMRLKSLEAQTAVKELRDSCEAKIDAISAVVSGIESNLSAKIAGHLAGFDVRIREMEGNITRMQETDIRRLIDTRTEYFEHKEAEMKRLMDTKTAHLERLEADLKRQLDTKMEYIERQDAEWKRLSDASRTKLDYIESHFQRQFHKHDEQIRSLSNETTDCRSFLKNKEEALRRDMSIMQANCNDMEKRVAQSEDKVSSIDIAFQELRKSLLGKEVHHSPRGVSYEELSTNVNRLHEYFSKKLQEVVYREELVPMKERITKYGDDIVSIQRAIAELKAYPPAPTIPVVDAVTPAHDVQVAVRNIERRGNIRVDSTTGHVELLHSLDFEPRFPQDEPSAVFKNNMAAMDVCQDLAEICNIFGCPVKIEGHTKGGEGQFWQILAKNRAHHVAEALVRCGADASLLFTRGMPGKMGRNEIRSEIVMNVLRGTRGQSWGLLHPVSMPAIQEAKPTSFLAWEPLDKRESLLSTGRYSITSDVSSVTSRPQSASPLTRRVQFN